MIVHLFIASLACLGINKITAIGMIFENLGTMIYKAFGKFWSKPLIACLPCMASFHGSWYYIFVINGSLWLWPVFVLALSGLNYFSVSILYYINPNGEDAS